jgi:integrase
MASVRKRTWTGNDGKPCEAWVVEYTDATGKRRRETPKTGLKKDAERLRQKIERDLTDMLHVPTSGTTTVKHLADMFLKHTDARVEDNIIRPSRRRRIAGDIRHIVSQIGHVKLTELTTQHVEKTFRHFRDNGQAAHTAKQTISTLKLMQDYAIKRGYMAKRPVSDAMSDFTGTGVGRIKTFTTEEVSRLLAGVQVRKYKGRSNPFLMAQCFVNIAAFCGLRFGEIIGLRVENLDLEKRMIRVRHSYCRLTKRLNPPKTRAGHRDVPMPPHVVVLCRKWMAKHYQENDLGVVFAGERKTVVTQQNFHTLCWVPLLKSVGLYTKGDIYHFHALRHFAASWMIENGMPLTDVAALLGHSKFDMTLQVYAHPMRDDRQRHLAMEAMASRMLSLPPTIDLELTATEIRVGRDKNAPRAKNVNEISA